MVKETDIYKHKDVYEIDVSDKLKADIEEWNQAYQDTFDNGNPLESGFVSAALTKEHIEQGMQLSVRLQEELGRDYKVEFLRYY